MMRGQACCQDKPFRIWTSPGMMRGQACSEDKPFRILGTSRLSGQAIQNLDKPWNDERTSLLSGQAIQNSWDKPFLGTSHSEFLGQARILGTKQLGHIGIVKGIGQALE